MSVLVRVPRAWGAGGEAMTEAAMMDIGLPEAATVAEDTLVAQNERIVEVLPERPLVLGGCCCAHVGGARGVAGRHGRVAIVWIDAHGDLNTPETSPSGNEWGMPLRMLLDAGDVAHEDTALLGARDLDPPERDYIEATGLAVSREQLDLVLDGVVGAYIALDCDVLDPREIDVFMPAPDGPSLDEVEALVQDVADRVSVLGMGLTGLVASDANLARLARLYTAAGFGG
jgi:arginase